MKPTLALGALAAAIALAAPAGAAAAPITSVFGGAVACSTIDASGGSAAGQRHCQAPGAAPNVSTVPSFDGTPIDVSVTLPPISGDDGNLPVIGLYHGYGSSKVRSAEAATQRWVQQGYAVFSMTDRGFFASCGKTSPVQAQPVCANGKIHLMSNAWEVRDAQYLLGQLADEGVIDPQRIGATGGSYGGGLALQLGALRNRIQLPDGTLQPWTSPGGKAMQIAATVPEYGWSDLIAALQPNGSTLDYATQNPYTGPLGDRRFGIQKLYWNTALYGGGAQAGNYAAPGTDPTADITSWKSFNDTGGPYDGQPLAQQQIAEFPRHGAVNTDLSVAPAPALISNGWNDDLFPVSEAVRYYNRVRAAHPTAPIAMYDINYGHPGRSGTPPTTTPLLDILNLQSAQNTWMARYLKGGGTTPAYADPVGGVTLTTSACSGTTPTGGATYLAKSWVALSPGEIRVAGAAKQTIAPGTQPQKAFEDGATTVCDDGPAADTTGAAVYSTDPAPAGGFTIAGSPTVHADLTVAGANDAVISRLYDVDPGAGTEKLIARGIYRPTAVGSTSRQVFQLHPQAYAIAAGHRVKLELLSADVPYARPATGQQPVDVANVDLRLPTIDRPGAAGGLVKTPEAKVLPAGYTQVADRLDVAAPAPTPVAPVVIAPSVTNPAPGPVVAPKPKDPVAVTLVRGQLRKALRSVKVSSTRSMITFKDRALEAGTFSYRVSIDARSGKATRRYLLGKVTKKVTRSGTVTVKITVSKSRRALLKRNRAAKLIVSTAFTSAVERVAFKSTRKVRQ